MITDAAFRIAGSIEGMVLLQKIVNSTFLQCDCLEEEVRGLVEDYGFEVRGCLGVLIEATGARLITGSGAMKAAEELRSSGYRISNKTLKSFGEALKLMEGKME